MDKQDKKDILIIGGGLIGATLLQALKTSNTSVLLVDEGAFLSEQHRKDTRFLALSPSSVGIFEHLGIWNEITEKTPIDRIHISEEGAFGSASFERTREDALGYVVSMHALMKALYAGFSKIDLLQEAKLIALQDKKTAIFQSSQGEISISAKLFAATDGTNSSVRKLSGIGSERKSYAQSAIVSTVTLNAPHEGLALERFTKDGSLALLPIASHQAALVLALPTLHAKRLIKMGKNAFIHTLRTIIKKHYPSIIDFSEPHIFPIEACKTLKKAAWPFVFLGNAAQTLHPLAAQGFNLGLRDVAMFSECVRKGGVTEEMLETYRSLRSYDQAVIPRFTDGLKRLFSLSLPGMSFVRGMGLLAFDNSSFLKYLLKRHASGFHGIVPELVFGEIEDHERA